MPGAAEGPVPSSLMDTPLTEERRAARRVRRRVCPSGSPTAPTHGGSDDAQEMSTDSTEVSSSDCYIQLSSESSDDGYENRSSGHRRKRRKTSVISSASEQSGEDSPSAYESLESDDVQITPGQDYVLPQRCDLSNTEKNRVVALIKEIKPKVTVFVAIMLRSYSSYVTIPKDYAVEHFPHESATVTLQSPGKNKKWHPRFYKKGTMIKLTGTWLHFVRDNGVHVGDICIFVPAKGGKPFTFTVHLLPKETTDSQTEVSHESSECEDSHGQPPYVLPYGARLSPSERSAVQKKVHSIQSEVPIYVSIMTKSNLGSRHMELSKRYAAEHLPHRNVTLMFQYMGKTWNINMLFHDRKYPKRWYLIGGWSKFIADNSLRLGDICLFELKKDKKELTVIVHLLRKESIDHPSGGSPVPDLNYMRASTMIASTVRVGEEPDDEEETSSSAREEEGFDDEPIEHNHSEGVSKAHVPTAPCSESNASGMSLSSEAREQAAGCSKKSFATEFPNKPSSTTEHNRIIHTKITAASEVIGLSDYTIHNSCDSIDSQGGESLAVQQQSSPSPGIGNSINRDSSSGDHRRAEHVEGESDVALQSLVRVTGQQVRNAEKEVNASGGDNTLADLPHHVAAVPSQGALPMPKEKTDTQTNRSVQLDVAQAQPPQGEVGQAGLSGVASPQPLQPEMQASTSREIEAQMNVVIQSAQPSVAPSQLAQGEAEQDLSGVASPSQPETRPSISGFVETRSNLVTRSVQQSIAPVQFAQEQADLSGVASAQPLVPEMQPSNPFSNIPLERTHPNRSQSSRQPEAAAGSAQPAQLFPEPLMMFNHPPIGDEPLKNELHRLRLHIDSLDKIYELKQSQLQTECSQEIEKIKQKYDLLLEERDSVHLEQMKTLDGLLEKVVFHQSLSADFRAKFISSSAAQAKAYSPPIHQTPQASQQAPTRLSGVTSTSLPAGRPVVPGDTQPSHVDRPSTSASSQAPRPPLPSPPVVRPPINPGNLVRTTGAHPSHMPRVPLPPRGSHRVPSAPAPHLQHRLPPRTHTTAPANQRQQQQHATSASPQSSHVVPPVSSSPLPPSSSQPTDHGSSTRMDVEVVCLSDDDE
ncbi:hypothetical protein ZWY2020_020299 [Hordeum vulgare]|nr:hypothetical protein ZWY2020_020299 [Hordeum vulgare]